MRYTKKDIADAMVMLHKFLKPGSKVYTILRTVSRSGMSRTIDLYTFQDNDRIYLSGYAATVMGDSRTKDGAIKVSGCGMDMGFHLVYSLSRTLFPKGFTLPDGQHSRNNDPSRHDNDGGYALNQAWL